MNHSVRPDSGLELLHPRVPAGGDSQRAERAPAADTTDSVRARSLLNLLAAFLVLAAPALWTGLLVFNHGVDTPWGDEWDGTWPLIEKMNAGTLRAADFFTFHNEHRIVFPKLLAFGVAQLTHWNVRAELLMIWLLACVCSLSIWRLSRLSAGSAASRHWLLFGANVLLFSPLQWENFLWGFQIGFLLPLATTTACLWIAATVRAPFSFVATLVLCLVSTFSIASGFVSWMLAAPLLLFVNRSSNWRAQKTWWLVWSVSAIASVYVYFHGYQRPAAHPSALEALKDPLSVVQFFFAYLGGPFSGGIALNATTVSQFAGVCLFVPLLPCMAYLWRWRGDHALITSSLPWVSLALFAIANASLTALGRTGFGIHAAVLSRYVSFAMMLPIALLFLVSQILRHRQELSASGAAKSHARTAQTVFVAAFALLFVCATIKSLDMWERFEHRRLTGKAALLMSNVVDEPELLVQYVHWSGAALKERMDTLDRIGFSNLPLVRSKRILEIAYRSSPGTNGEVKASATMPNGDFAIAGWAVLPAHHRVADAVVLTYDDPTGAPIIFALTDVKDPAPEVSNRFQDKTYLRSAWAKTCKAVNIPAEARLIRAWAFDAELCRAFPIGSALIEPGRPTPQ